VKESVIKDSCELPFKLELVVVPVKVFCEFGKRSIHFFLISVFVSIKTKSRNCLSAQVDMCDASAANS